MKIVVLAGGLSPERDVSLSSGSLIANALIENGHSVALVDLYLGVDARSDFRQLFIDKSAGKTFRFAVPEQEPDLQKLKEESGNGDVMIGGGVLEICRYADLAFIALHGSVGENGQLQAVFDCFGIPYTGSGFFGSALAMDKDVAKQIMARHSIPTPPWALVGAGVAAALDSVGLPCVVKPLSCGSSVGVTIVRDADKLEEALCAGRKYESTLIVEKLIEGRELQVGILDGKALPVIEIIPRGEFYDYANKYQPDFAREVCPAEIPEEVARRLQDCAEQVHAALRLGYYSRIDFMLDKDENHWCLEANTLPGMTPTSLLPQEAAAAGISYNALCEKIVNSK